MNKHDSKSEYDQILAGFRDRFDWMRLNDEDIDPVIVGLPTVLMDDLITPQFIEKLKKEPDLHDEWSRFFGFIEELMQSENSIIRETIETTILEVLASENDIDLESVLSYCGEETCNSIFDSISTFYGRPERAENLRKLI